MLPEKFHPDVLNSLHDDLGHMGVDRTLDLVRNRFYWPLRAYVWVATKASRRYSFRVTFERKRRHSQYVKNLKSHLEESFRIASENSKWMAERNKTWYDKSVRASTVHKGDRILVRSVRLRGKKTNSLTDGKE